MKNILFLVVLILYKCFVYSSESNVISLRMKIKNQSIVNQNYRLQNNRYLHSTDTFMDRIFTQYKITKFEQSFPSAKYFNHPLAANLLRTYTMVSDTDMVLLRQVLNNTAKDYFDSIYEIPKPVETSGTFYPNDPQEQSWMYFKHDLTKTRQAWTITQGNSNTKIAIYECCRGFDLTHEDLQSKIVYAEPASYTSTPPGHNEIYHGTMVAGLAGAATNNGIGHSGAGFNCSLMLYGNDVDYNDFLDIANLGGKVINCSWITCFGFPDDQAVVDIITDLGVVLVASSGNGNYGGNCNTHGYGYPASFNNVISVTGIAQNSAFENGWCCANCCVPNSNCANSQVSTQNDKVDVAAPGFCVPSTIPLSGYDMWGTGTSFSSPLVAGIVGLIKSINPCLKTPQVEALLKATGDDISTIGNNVTYYPSSPVPKRVNAYEAVRQAAIPVSLFFKNQILTASNIYQASFAIFAGSNEDYPTLTGNTTINPTANITFKAREYISLGSEFEVKLGATFEAKTELINCQ